MVDEDKFETEKRAEDSMNFHSSSMTSDWPYNCDMLPGSSMGLSSAAACDVNGIGSSSCASDPMMDSCHDSWSRPAVGHNMGLSGINLGNNVGMLEQMRGSSECMRPMFDGGWNPMIKGGLFLPNAPGVLPRSLSQFPADSGFIERAARFSCFGSGNFSDMVAPFAAPESVSPYAKNRSVVGGPNIGNVLRPLSFENEVNVAKAPNMSSECGGQQDGSLPRNGSVPRSLDEARQGRGASSNESDEANCRGSDGPEEPSMLNGAGGETCSAMGYGGNKRKRAPQSAKANKVNGTPQKSGNGSDTQQRSEQNPSPGTNNKTSEKTEQKSQGADTAKEEYIHVRARRGQATNSHSLAERVRREKISERMKFLQDLVPGCSKVTGKAVMLDEIINYVQSLQRQVEFLSMKLATVNPRLDIDIESLITKDMFQPRAGQSSSLGFPSDAGMTYPHLIPQPGQYQASHPMSANSSDLRRTMSTHLAAMGYKEPVDPQLQNMWDDELHNVVHMGFGNSSEPANSQDLNDSHQSGPMKSEP